MDIDEVNIDEDITENLEEDTKYKIKLDAPKSEPAFDDSGSGGLDAFADAPTDDAGGFGDEAESEGDKPFDEEPFDAGVEASEEEDPEKYIQQLAGKIGTSMRKYNDERGEPDFDLEKYAINSVISASHTSEMDEEDQDDIIRKVKTSGAADDTSDAEKEVSAEPEVEPEVDSEPTSDTEEVFSDELSEEDTMTINLTNMRDDAEAILAMDKVSREKKLKGHKWADDHISTSADDAEEVADFLTTESNPCWDGYARVPGTIEGEKGSCKKKTSESLMEAEHQGNKVTLNKPSPCKKDDKGCSKKFKVYVKNDKGNVVKVQFGDKDMEIRRDNAEAKKSFRARHKCSEKKDKTTAGYWSCKMWSNKKVSDIVGEDLQESKKNDIFVENKDMKIIIKGKLDEMVEPAIKPPVVKPGEKPSRRTKRIWEPKPIVKPRPKMGE